MANYTASWDMLTFFHATRPKIVQVCAKIMQRSGLRSVSAIPAPRQQQLKTYHELFNRFERGKFNFAEREADEVASLSQWIAMEHARLHGHPEKSQIMPPWRQHWIATNSTTTPPPRKESWDKAGQMAYEVEQYVAEQTGAE